MLRKSLFIGKLGKIVPIMNSSFDNPSLQEPSEIEEEAGELTYNLRTLLVVVSQRECDNVPGQRLGNSSEQFPNRNLRSIKPLLYPP
ncbi:hypothetical protein AVEN_202187-1 [Araneus ventricosus]|uniref:Uncharacterized protein n=1 Tax=Araneus ventricosus TaxID=182803 RepID=A0A4Y2AM90_ARAVE|nr:hypothetical protein AVEN_202187-1 [Araneus ventricosus]